MADSNKQEIIIVRRYEQEEETAKGGVWKIAHADFMTAMMAFFLVMWLISATDENTRTNVANYFNPVQLAESTPNRKGLEEPQNVPADGTPDATKDGLGKGSGEGAGGMSHQLKKPRFKEGALFQDPYAILAKIAAEVDPEPQDMYGADATPGESTVPGLSSGEASRDPFDPMYWQVAPVVELKTATASKPGTAAPAPGKSAMDALAPSTQDQMPAKGARTAAAPKATVPDEVKQPEAAQSVAPAQPAEAATVAHAADAKLDPKADKQSAADLKAAELKDEIAKAIEPTKDRSPSPTIEVRRTGAGTLISLTDDFDFSMFAVGSAEPQPKVVKAMEKIARILQSRPGKIVVRGHTDGRPFKSENYDNWRLSQARAQMALYMLVRGGLPEDRIVRVEGHADRDLKVTGDSNADQNRRIEILLQE